MGVTASSNHSALDAATLAEVARIRDSGVLGASGRLLELFDFLVDRSAGDAPPKEAEIALSVFGKPDTDASRDDPVARVYIHRLRKRLGEFYQRHGTGGDLRLDIPRGEYRIVGLPRGEGADLSAALTAPTGKNVNRSQAGPTALLRRWPALAAAFAGLLVLGNAIAWFVLANGGASSAPSVAKSAIWSPLANSERPLLVVVGDYYMFGEYEDRLFLTRLIRDFSINSKDDLIEHYLTNPREFDRYGDVALQYLPTSTAFALADLMPMMATDRPTQVMLASELTPDRLKSSDIVFVGLLSGLGKLREPVFARSRFGFGESYDEIVDRESGRTYTSEAFLAAPNDAMYRDYGYFATFAGPAGNRIMVLSGSRDTALMGVAESLTRPEFLKDLRGRVGKAPDFEALFEVKGQKHVNLETGLLAFASIDSTAVWSGEPVDPPAFPLE